MFKYLISVNIMLTEIMTYMVFSLDYFTFQDYSLEVKLPHEIVCTHYIKLLAQTY